MRIVSYNVRYFAHPLKGLGSTSRAKQAIARALIGLDPRPDVICLQEIEARSLRSRIAHRPRHADETQLEAFMQALDDAARVSGRRAGYEAWYFPAHAYRLGRFKLYTTGLAILIDSETLHVVQGNHHEPKGVTVFGAVRAVKQKRIVAHLEVEDLRGRRFHVFNTHLSLPTPFRSGFWSAAARMGFGPNQLVEAQAVADYLDHTAGRSPAVLAGDFNAAPGSPVYRMLTGDRQLSGAQAALGQIDPARGDSFATAGFMRWRMHLDHLLGRGVRWLDVQGTCHFDDRSSPFCGWSDHAPLIARFELG